VPNRIDELHGFGQDFEKNDEKSISKLSVFYRGSGSLIDYYRRKMRIFVLIAKKFSHRVHREHRGKKTKICFKTGLMNQAKNFKNNHSLSELRP